MGELYCTGDHEQLLDHPVNDVISQFNNCPTIIANIKINLLFSAINCFTLSTKQIIHLHGFITKENDALEIKPDDFKGEPNLYWDYKSSHGLNLNSLECDKATTLILNATKFSALLRQNQSKRSTLNLAELELENTLLTFSNFHEITQAIMPVRADICQVVIGFKQTIDYLEQLERLSKIYSAGSKSHPTAEDENLRNTLSEQKQFLQLSPHTPAPSDTKHVINARKLKTNYNQYIVIELKAGNFYVNNLILIKSGEGLDLGIIRSIQMTPHTKTQRIIVETLDNIVSYADVNNSNNTKTKGLIQYMEDDSFSIYLPPDYTQPNMTIQISRSYQSENYQTTKLLENRPRFQHFKITPH